MALATTLTTELEAVNALLDSIGQGAIPTLPPAASNADANMAYTILNRIFREVQSSSWGFNTEEVIVTAVANLMTLPTGTLYCYITEQNGNRDFVQRGVTLYDRVSHSTTIPTGETCTIVATKILPWDQLMEHARNYIFVRAARIFQDRVVGSPTLHAYQERDELVAFANLQQADAAIQGRTFLLARGVYEALRRSC